MTLSLRSRVQRVLLASVLAGFVIVGLSADNVRAQGAPDSLSIQGFLTNPGGEPLNTTVSIVFKLYKNSTVAWMETQPSVTVTDGVFNVLLGGVTPLDTVAFDQPIDLGITVGGDPEIAPLTPLGAASFALGLRGMYAVWAEDEGPNGSYNIIGGAPNNSAAADVVGATIGGGGGTAFGAPAPNTVTDDFATIGGGFANTAGGYASTVGGGESNSAGDDATVGGGTNNSAGGQESTIGGGGFNTAGATRATVGGGNSNTASGILATVGGGASNTASGQFATVPGGSANHATGAFSFAAGRRARAQHGGTFVWADSAASLGVEFASTGPDQFLIRAGGGVGIGTNAPNHPLEMASGAHVTAGGVWTDVSSREQKEDFQAVDGEQILEQLATLPITRWRYKNEESAVHLGPVAEDFYAAFGLGADNAHIAALDGNGVALAAIKGLLERIVALETEVSTLRKEQGRKKRRS